MNTFQWLGLILLSFPFAVLGFILIVKTILWINKEPVEALLVVCTALGTFFLLIGGLK